MHYINLLQILRSKSFVRSSITSFDLTPILILSLMDVIFFIHYCIYEYSNHADRDFAHDT
jgi:hypothetical protein